MVIGFIVMPAASTDIAVKWFSFCISGGRTFSDPMRVRIVCVCTCVNRIHIDTHTKAFQAGALQFLKRPGTCWLNDMLNVYTLA